MLQVAHVEEAACIGCTACYTACPTGAIVGAAKHIHTVLPELCTGCNACIEACPVPCITMQAWPDAAHPLQGINAAAADAVIAAHTARRSATTLRTQAENIVQTAAPLAALSPALTAKAASARAKAIVRQSLKGPRPL